MVVWRLRRRRRINRGCTMQYGEVECEPVLAVMSFGIDHRDTAGSSIMQLLRALAARLLQPSGSTGNNVLRWGLAPLVAENHTRPCC